MRLDLLRFEPIDEIFNLALFSTLFNQDNHFFCSFDGSLKKRKTPLFSSEVSLHQLSPYRHPILTTTKRPSLRGLGKAKVIKVAVVVVHNDEIILQLFFS